MPFSEQIAAFINDSLKAGSLSKAKLQPAKFYGLSTTYSRSSKGSKEPGKLENLPGIISPTGGITAIIPDSKLALQVYHKLSTQTYTLEKKSYGNDHYVKCVSEMAMVVISNSKLTGIAKEALEPVIVFGMPQKLSTALSADLKIEKCLITPLASNLDQMQVFKQEYPQSPYFLTEQMGMFLIKYRVEITASKTCIDLCLCN